MLAAGVVLMTGCYATFSPESGRREIVRQTGMEPRDTFEFQLEGATMSLAKTMVSKVAGGQTDFGGLDRVDVAVYELPAGKQVDLGKIPSRGWDRMINTREGDSSFMVLVRTNGDTLADMVVMAQGSKQLLYGRLKGRLSRDLPGTLQKAMRATGIEGLKDRIISISPEDEESPKEPPPREAK